MVRTRLLVLLGAAVLLGLIGVYARAGMSVPTPPIKWEYKVVFARGGVQKEIEDALNKSGAESWELAGIYGLVGGSGGNVSTNGFLIFKRQR
jgi:hypothetical protein